MVVDANIVAAALIRPGGWTAQELSRTDVEWLAPTFLLDELAEHASDYAAKAGCALPEWNRRVSTLAKRLSLVATSGTVAAAQDPIVRHVEAIDPDDAPYVAALAASNADLLWTRDVRLLEALPGRAVSVVPQTLT